MSRFSIAALIMPLILITLCLPMSGCNYGVFGKKGAPLVAHLDQTLGTSVDTVVKEIDSTQKHVLGTLNDTRNAIFDFLVHHTKKEAHDISVGILQGTIGYLDKTKNRDALAEWLETIINHTVGPAREQLIQLRDQLLDPIASKKLGKLLHAVMYDLVLDPAANLLNLVLSDTTRRQLDKMLSMIIPAMLNDSAIKQIGKLREALLGVDMKKDLASLVDTVLLVANHRLDSPIRGTIDKIVNDNTSNIKKNAVPIIIGLTLLAIIVGLVIYLYMRQQVKLHQEMLTQVTMQIEEMNKTGTQLHNPEVYENLTDSIADAMKRQGLEIQMNKFLKDRGIS